MKRLLALAALAASPANAAPYADSVAIDRAVAEFTGAPVGQPGGAAQPVDRRLRLTPCATPLALDWYGARREAVTVQCPSAGWRLFVALKSDPAAAPATTMIARGDAVSIQVSGSGFAVSQAGEALESGGKGAWIRIRTAAGGSAGRGEALRAQVIRPGLVGISLPE
jgi:flagella basal body P-ring formation protein FlgA